MIVFFLPLNSADEGEINAFFTNNLYIWSMSKNFESVLEQVNQLTRYEQLALIASIAQMIGEDESDIFPEYVIKENRRRLAAYDAGEIKAISYKDAMSYVRDQLTKRRWAII